MLLVSEPDPSRKGNHEPFVKEKVGDQGRSQGDGYAPAPFLSSDRPEQNEEQDEDVDHVTCDFEEGCKKKEVAKVKVTLDMPPFSGQKGRWTLAGLCFQTLTVRARDITVMARP